LTLLSQVTSLSNSIKQSYKKLSGQRLSVSFSEIWLYWGYLILNISFISVQVNTSLHLLSVDEAHRLKKVDCNLASVLKRYSSEFRLLLTVSLPYPRHIPPDFEKIILCSICVVINVAYVVVDGLSTLIMVLNKVDLETISTDSGHSIYVLQSYTFENYI
jgi:hypothetical protein